MTSLLQRPVTRWVAPLATAVLFIAGGSVVSALTSAAHADLAPRSAAQLLVDVEHAKLAGLSGTIVQNADLGLPALPTGAVSGLAGSDSSMTALLSGTHTLRTWYAGPEHVRLALLGQLGESDLIRNGRDLWSWSSSSATRGTAEHWVLPTDSGSRHHAGGPALPGQALTPQQAAEKALSAISPSTTVTTNGTAVVANRPAYLLTLAPRTSKTLIESVQIAIDGRTHVPTRVQVYANGTKDPVFSVGFTSFDPSTPSMSVFGFNPPPGTKVTQGKLSDLMPGGKVMKDHRAAGHTGTPLRPTVVGSDWSTVLVTHLPSKALAELTSPGGKKAGPLGAVLAKLPEVHGTWGSGRLLAGTVFSALLTDDGRLAVGAVPPSQLYAALAGR
ncbi:LolA family protein [Nocardioides terrisoli]|uniref:LolA family protein n=1 Tax=Nocardioides terrisoli TaxID=3388267 RepID=UPI00287BA10C|nr:hypothetical protein [Nocardioides marmorisolisilvae]